MKRVYDIVRQRDDDRDYYTIFVDNQQYCDDNGAPICYDSIEEAAETCKKLNEELN